MKTCLWKSYQHDPKNSIFHILIAHWSYEYFLEMDHTNFFRTFRKKYQHRFLSIFKEIYISNFRFFKIQIFHVSKVFWPQLDAHEAELAHTLHAKNCVNFRWFAPIPGLPGLKKAEVFKGFLYFVYMFLHVVGHTF